VLEAHDVELFVHGRVAVVCGPVHGEVVLVGDPIVGPAGACGVSAHKSKQKARRDGQARDHGHARLRLSTGLQWQRAHVSLPVTTATPLAER